MSEVRAASAGTSEAVVSGARRRVLQTVAYVSLSLPILWMLGIGVTSRLFAVRPESMVWSALVPVWLTLAAVSAYHLYVLATLYRPALGSALALGAIWTAGALSAIVVSGLEAGVTVALVLLLVLSFVHVNAMSLIEFLGAASLNARVGVYALSVAATASPVGLAAGVGVVVLGTLGPGIALTAMGLVMIVVSLAPAVAAALLSRKARRSARELLERTRPEEPAAAE